MIAPFSSPFTLALTHLYSLRTTLQSQKMDQTENSKLEVSNEEVQAAGTEATQPSETSLKVKQLQDMVEILSAINVRNLDEEARDEAVYIVNDIIISIEELMDLFPR